MDCLSLIKRLVLTSVCLLSGVSCAGPSFHKLWRESLAENKTPAVGTNIEGAWDGTWKSESNGHHGRLQCVIQPPATEDASEYPFHYRATWMGFLSGSYHSPHEVKKVGEDEWTFSGEHRLPNWAGGLYHYDGTIKGNHFSASYTSSLDRGRYEMTRVNE